VAAAVAAKGLDVGRDVLLAACVDGIGVGSPTPPITAIDLRPRAHGRACADLLLQVLAEPADGPTGNDPRTVQHEPELRLRASTRAG
jgi:DNA-binding LacI/PurR family transcriptional regulator